MPVPTTIADLSSVASLNSPQGGDFVGGMIDDYFRAHAAIIKNQFIAGADIASATTLSIPPDGQYFAVTGSTAITSLAATIAGRLVYLKFAAGIVLTHSANLIMPQGVSVTTLTDDVAVFLSGGSGVWRCVSYPRLYLIGQGTPTAVSGSSVVLSGIPAGVQRVKLLFSGVSATGTTALYTQLGTSSGIQITGYLSVGAIFLNAGAPTVSNGTAGFITNGGASNNDYTGSLVLERISSNLWEATGMWSAPANGAILISAGRVTLSAELTQLRITMGSGTDTFNAGTIKATWEF